MSPKLRFGNGLSSAAVDDVPLARRAPASLLVGVDESKTRFGNRFAARWSRAAAGEARQGRPDSASAFDSLGESLAASGPPWHRAARWFERSFAEGVEQQRLGCACRVAPVGRCLAHGGFGGRGI